jgi:hypothetical protein
MTLVVSQVFMGSLAYYQRYAAWLLPLLLDILSTRTGIIVSCFAHQVIILP